MTDFEIHCNQCKGKTCSGRISANDIRQARKKVQQTHLSVLKVKVAGEKSNASTSGGEKNKPAKARTLQKNYTSKSEGVGLEFLKRLLELHGSGMPVADAVKLLNHRLSDPQQRSISGALWKELAEEEPCLEQCVTYLDILVNHQPALLRRERRLVTLPQFSTK